MKPDYIKVFDWKTNTHIDPSKPVVKKASFSSKFYGQNQNEIKTGNVLNETLTSLQAIETITSGDLVQ